MMTKSATAERIDAQCKKARVLIALHVPTNKRYAIVMEIPGVGVDLKDLENHERVVKWDDWLNADIWSKN